MSSFIKNIIIAIAIGVCCTSVAFAQADYKSEADLKKQAEKLFESQQYSQAFPLYSQLLALYQKDANYNYKFGACMLYSSEDKEKPMLYLKYAAGIAGVDAEAFYFLAKAYQLNYRFNDAIKNYENYQKLKAGKTNPKFEVARAIETCNNGKGLINKPTELVVLDKKEIVVSDFFRSYSLQGINGKLVVKPEDFCSKIDLKRKDASIMYISPDDKFLYYSSWGDNEKNSRDIYRIQKLPSGGFGVPENLGAIINTTYDEEYAFMHPDGKTLFFCSKGHNSMGGFDVFKSEYDESNNAWSKPENVDFPINSPDDDMLYLTDAEYKVSYFSSKRGSKMNYTKVYKIKEGAKANVLVMLAGKFIQPTKNLMGATISVRKIDEEKKLIAIVKTNAANKYMVNLPSSGKYQFTVETNGIPVQSAYVDVPQVSQYTAYKQQITYETVKDKKEVLAVKSDFDTPLTTDELQEVLKNQAELEVNFDEEISKQLVEERTKTETSAKDIPLDVKNTTAEKDNTQVATNSIVGEDINAIINHAKKAQEDANTARANADNSLVYAYLQAKQANELQTKLNTLILKQSNTNDATEKETIANEIAPAKKELMATVSQVNQAKRANEEQAKLAEAKQAEADNVLGYAKAYDAAKGAPSDKLKELKNKASVYSATELVTTPEQQALAQNKAEYTENIKQQEELKKDIAESKAEQDNLNGQIARTKDKDIKVAFKSQVEELKLDVESKENDLSVLQVKGDKLNDKIKTAEATNGGNTTIIATANETVSKLTTKPAIDNAEINRLMADVSTTTATEEIADVNTTTKPNATEANKSNDLITNVNDNDNKSKVIDADVNNSSNSNKTNIDTKSNNLITNVSDNDNKSNESVTNVNQSSATIPVITKNYSPEIQAKKYVQEAELAMQKTNAIADTEIRKKEQLKSYKEFDAVLVDEINTLKEKQQVTKLISDKNKINSEIAELTQLKQEVNEKIVEVAATTEKTSDTAVTENITTPVENTIVTTKATENNNTAVTETTLAITPQAQANTIVTSEKSYPEKINELSKIEDVNIREAAKIEVNEAFVEKLNNDIATNKAEVKNARSADEKNRLETEIAAYENVKKQKIKEINDSKKLVATTTNSSNNVAISAKAIEPAVGNNVDTSTTNAVITTTKITEPVVDTKIETTTNTISTDTVAITKVTEVPTNNTPAETAVPTIGYNVLSVKPTNIAADLLPVADKTATVSYTNTDARTNLADAQSTYTAYEQKNTEAANLLKQAKANPSQKTALTLKADASRQQAKEKLIEYNTQLYSANKAEYELNKYTTQEFKNKYEQSTTSKALAAELLNDEAESYFDQAKKVRTIANSTKDLNTKLDAQTRAYDLEAKAITKQQQSIATYTNINTNDATLVAQNAQQKYTAKTPTSNTNVASTTTSIINNETLPDNTTSPEIKNTTEYRDLVATKDEANALENNSIKQQQRAEKENERANNNQQQADKLIMQANASSDNKERQRLFEKADSLNSVIARERDVATANQTAAANYKNEASVKEQEANQLLQTLDKKTYENTTSLEPKDSAAVDTKATTNTAGSTTNVNNKIANNPVMLNSEVVSGGGNKTIKTSIISTANNATTDSATTKTELLLTEVKTEPIINNANKIITAATTNNNSIASTTANNEVGIGTTDVFEKKSTIAYTNNNPIPLNQPLPQGLLFKVQIGAFRNPIPQDLFRGFNPLFGESTPNGLVRYTAGSFRNYKNANTAKNEIRGIGYKDAFVVAYYNGKRVSYAEAMTLVNESSAAASALEATSVLELKEFVRNAPTNNATTISASIAPPQPIDTVKVVQSTPIEINVTNDVKSVEIRSIQGLAFTVQVGVYGKKVTTTQLFNIQPLNVEATTNNYLRYSSGLYNDINTAAKAKAIIVGYGIKDAFITAYYNGKRITATEAKQLVQAQGNKIFIQGVTINTMPSRK